MTAQPKSPAPRRKILFVDARIQGTLLVRVTMYWIFALMAVTLMLLAWRIIAGPEREFVMRIDAMWLAHGPALIASLLLLPVVLVDVVKISNRIVGPLVRLRRGMRALAEGTPVAPLNFREGDYWHEVACDFNTVAAKLQRDHLAGQPADEEALAAAP